MQKNQFTPSTSWSLLSFTICVDFHHLGNLKTLQYNIVLLNFNPCISSIFSYDLIPPDSKLYVLPLQKKIAEYTNQDCRPLLAAATGPCPVKPVLVLFGRPAGKLARPRSSSRARKPRSWARKLRVCRCESNGLSAPTDGREIRWRGAPLGGRGAPPQKLSSFWIFFRFKYLSLSSDQHNVSILSQIH